MIMFTYLIEFLSLVLFVGCVWHATRFQGRAYAQQWFVGAYLYAFVRETITQVFFQSYEYAPSILRLGAAPAIVGLLWGSIFYLAAQFTRRLIPPERSVTTLVLVFAVAASIALPIEAEAAQLHWWLYEGAMRTVFGGVPWVVPLVWGAGAAIFYAVFSRVNGSRLPDRGKLYALVTLSPAIAAADLLFALVIGAL
jgi:hypothetical protein